MDIPRGPIVVGAGRRGPAAGCHVDIPRGPGPGFATAFRTRLRGRSTSRPRRRRDLSPQNSHVAAAPAEGLGGGTLAAPRDLVRDGSAHVRVRRLARELAVKVAHEPFRRELGSQNRRKARARADEAQVLDVRRDDVAMKAVPAGIIRRARRGGAAAGTWIVRGDGSAENSALPGYSPSEPTMADRSASAKKASAVWCQPVANMTVSHGTCERHSRSRGLEQSRSRLSNESESPTPPK